MRGIVYENGAGVLSLYGRMLIDGQSAKHSLNKIQPSHTGELNILLTVIDFNKCADIKYSFCWRFMNNSVVVSSERTGKGARGFTPHVCGVFFGSCVPGCRVRLA